MILQQNVLIYNGPGTCQLSVQQTLRTFKQFLAHAYDVKLVDLQTLKNKNISWDRNCKLFVMPGGRDCYYDAHFREDSIADRIKAALESGAMKYFGLCAGAYFAVDRIEFERGIGDYEVIGERPLKLANCTAKGTLFPGLFKYSEFEGKDETFFQAVDIQKADGISFKSLYNGGCYFENTSNTIVASYGANSMPAIIVTDSFVLSGVHLEYDPIECLNHLSKPVDKSVMTTLIQFEEQRKHLLVELLAVLGLNVQVDSDSLPPKFTIYSSGVQLQSTEYFSFQPIDEAAPFNYSEFKRLLPSAIEKLNFWYAPVITSTQTVLLENSRWVEKLPNFSVFLADHQMRGRGRGANSWISSPACLQFTLLLKHPSDCSAMMPMIQYLMAIAVAETSNSLLNGSEFKTRIKWPNDVYFFSSQAMIGKVSGILVQSVNSLANPRIQNVFVGTGINVESDPLLKHVIHLNDFAPIKTSKEAFLAECLGRFQALYSEFLLNGKFPFTAYYRNWLHSEEKVTFEGEQVRIKGIDEFGYLKVQNNAFTTFSLEPDGNSFDMMNNLLKRK